MGAIAEAFLAYAQPLLDQTDGSEEQMKKAFALSQLCYNLAIFPDDVREKVLSETQSTMGLDDEEFDEFRRVFVDPMIRRHHDMFPGMGRMGLPEVEAVDVPVPERPIKGKPGEKYPGTDRYAPCPCNSGEKYKFCCGAKRR